MRLFGNDVRLTIIGCGPILRASRSPMSTQLSQLPAG